MGGNDGENGSMMMRMGMMMVMMMTLCFFSIASLSLLCPRVTPSLIFQACVPEWDGDGDNRDVPCAEGAAPY